MAVVKVKMITGWAAEQSSLRDLQGLQGIGSRIGLKRFDVEDNNDIQFYFDTVCFLVFLDTLLILLPDIKFRQDFCLLFIN